METSQECWGNNQNQLQTPCASGKWWWGQGCLLKNLKLPSESSTKKLHRCVGRAAIGIRRTSGKSRPLHLSTRPNAALRFRARENQRSVFSQWWPLRMTSIVFFFCYHYMKNFLNSAWLAGIWCPSKGQKVSSSSPCRQPRHHERSPVGTHYCHSGCVLSLVLH